jgi:hypothetical protein
MWHLGCLHVYAVLIWNVLQHYSTKHLCLLPEKHVKDALCDKKTVSPPSHRLQPRLNPGGAIIPGIAILQGILQSR